MRNEDKTKEQLAAELQELRQRVSSLETIETEHIKEKERFRESEERYRAIFENSRDATNIFSKDGKILDANQKLIQLSVYSKKELLTMNLQDLYPEAVKPATEERIKKMLQGKELPVFETYLLTKKGKKIPVEIGVTSLKNCYGQEIVFQGNIREIAKRKQVEEELNRYRQRLEKLVEDRTSELKKINEQLQQEIIERKQAEELLRKSEEKYRILAENAMDGIYLINPEGFEYINPAFEKILGYKAKEICNNSFNFYDLIHPEDKKLIEERKQAREKGKKLPSKYSFRVLTKDGKLKYVEVNTVPIPGEKVKILGMLRDITERKQAEEELRENETLFRSVVENSHSGILIVDDDYKFTYVNDELCRILGYSRGKIIGQDFRKFLDEESKKLVADRYVRRQKGEKVSSRYEFNVVRKDGKKRRVEISSSVIRDSAGKIKTVGQILDITERKQAEEALKESEARYRTLFEGVPIGLYRSTPDGRFLDVNPAMAQMLRYPDRESMLGINAKDFYVNPEDRKRWQAIIERKGVVENFEHRIRRKDGRIILVQDTARVVFGDQRQVLFYEGSLQDITERKQTEEKLKQTLAELERSNKELEQFAYVASHDLQEPLRMVSSYTQLLARRYKDKLDEDANDFITYAVDGATRMQTLINDLLTYSRIGTPVRPFKPTDCERVLQNVLNNLKVAIEENGASVTHEPLPTIMADSFQLIQLFQNLIMNAIKFRSKAPPRVHISAERGANEWIFSVRDNGIGIDPQYKERIFMIFQRLHGKGEYSGTGIGLAICKKIVEYHFGKIWVESESGKGAIFYFTFPLEGGK